MSTARVTLAILLIAAAATLVVILCMTGTAAAAGPDVQATPPASDCAGCHPDQTKLWESGNHAKAFSSEAFKTAWNNGQKPKYCLACHTTGYDAATGNYTQESVGCTACHQASPSGHPGGQMSINSSAEFCGTCHTTTYHEWQKSGHGQVNLACTSCHDMHSTSLRFQDVKDLCSSCHKQANEQAGMPMSGGAACTDCHMYTVSGVSRAEGKAPTGHSFVLDASACSHCHQSDIHTQHEISATNALQPGTDKLIAAKTSAAAKPAPAGMDGLGGLLGGTFGGLLLGVVGATALRRKQ